MSPELRPRAIASGLRHQPLERHLGTAPKLLEIRAGRNHERRRPARAVSEVMGAELGWDASRLEAELETWREVAAAEGIVVPAPAVA